MPYSQITEFTLPSIASIGERVEFTISAELVEAPEWSNFVIAIEYTDGPIDRLPILVGTTFYEIPKGHDVKQTFPLPDVGEKVSVICLIDRFYATGKYTLTAKTGHINTQWEEDARLAKEIEVIAQAPPPPITDEFVAINSLVNSIMVLMMVFALMSIMRSLLE